jgi:hypothetical protein
MVTYRVKATGNGDTATINGKRAFGYANIAAIGTTGRIGWSVMGVVTWSAATGGSEMALTMAFRIVRIERRMTRLATDK